MPLQTGNYKRAAKVDTSAAFIRQNWMYIIGGVIVIPILLKYLKFMQKTGEEQREEDEKTKLFKSNAQPGILDERLAEMWQAMKDRGAIHQHTYNQIKGAAQAISHDLGTIYSDTGSAWEWLDPRGWTENDGAVADTVIQYISDYGTVVAFYYCITRSRNLNDDLLKMLDDSAREQLKEANHYLFV